MVSYLVYILSLRREINSFTSRQSPFSNTLYLFLLETFYFHISFTMLLFLPEYHLLLVRWGQSHMKQDKENQVSHLQVKFNCV